MKIDYIIPYQKDHPDRDINLNFLLDHLIKYKDILDIYVVEEDSEFKFTSKYPEINHIKLFNDKHFNRGWAFNCCVKHYCENDFIICADTDLLLTVSFEDILEKFMEGYQVISGYDQILYSNNSERLNIIKNKN